MKIELIDINGKKVKDFELNDNVFNIEPNESVIHETIKNELANKRQGTASSKTKAEVRGTGAKPYRQKGTGRARVGTRQNPVWRGGGVAFGPKPRDFSYKIPKKIKRLAFKSILSLKNREGNLKVIENIKIENGKTKNFYKIFNPLLKEEKCSLLLTDNDDSLMIKRAGRNISWIKCLSYNRLNAHSLYYSKNIVITEDAATGLNNFFNQQKC